MSNRSPESLLPLTPLYFQILLALSDGHRHGYGMLKEIESQTGGSMKPATGTLYLALGRMEERRMIANAWKQRPAGEDSRRRYYKLTPFGRKVAVAETNRLLSMVDAALRKQLIGASSVAALGSERT